MSGREDLFLMWPGRPAISEPHLAIRADGALTGFGIGFRKVATCSGYGPGGVTQHFIPDMEARLAAGDIVAVDSTGNVIPFVDGKLAVGPGQTIPMHNLDLTPGSAVPSRSEVESTVRGVGTVVNALGDGAPPLSVAGARTGEGLR